MHKIILRKITPADNAAIAAVIRGVFDELNAPKTGTAYADPQLDRLSDDYSSEKKVYYIAEINGDVVGGAGIAPLENGPEGVCELQKMYTKSSVRGKGIGSMLMEKCLSAAKDFGFSQCYLETLPYMLDAQKLYNKYGFYYLDAPLGNTGHSSCPVWMLKDLEPEINNVPTSLKAYKKHFTEILTPQYGAAEAESFFHIAMEEINKLRRIDFVMQPDGTLTDTQLAQWQNVLQQLEQSRPIQYIFGKAHFYGLEFKVNENTLIPRPETEELVEWIIHENAKRSAISILDIGTGTGCIPVSLAANLPNATVSAIDVSVGALAIAKENASANNTNINFIQADILQATALQQQYDVIVSNPPYVRNLEKNEIKPNVLEYEPHLALFVEDTDPLVFYRKIAQLALVSLKPGGKLYFEINQYLGSETVALLENLGFKDIILRKDFAGNDRMIACNI